MPQAVSMKLLSRSSGNKTQLPQIGMRQSNGLRNGVSFSMSAIMNAKPTGGCRSCGH
jgi:hypothetical protein